MKPRIYLRPSPDLRCWEACIYHDPGYLPGWYPTEYSLSLLAEEVCAAVESENPDAIVTVSSSL